MKVKPWYKRIIFSSWLLALVPAAILMFFIKAAGYKFILETDQYPFPGLQVLYTDLNADSITEVVRTVIGDSYCFLTVKTNEQKIYDQWNLPDSLDPKISGIVTGNYDSDRYNELYVFSFKNDSLYLNINEILDPEGIRKEHLFISKIGIFRNIVESIISPAGFFDANGDGFNEFFFGMSSGFNLGPRRIYSYDIKNNSLNFSPAANNIPLNLRMSDADNDSRPEIYGDLSASGNFRRNVPFSDSSTWLMVLNEKLEFEFNPVEFIGFGNVLGIRPFNRSYAALHWAGGTDTSALESRIMIYSTDGRLMKFRPLSDLGFTGQTHLMVLENVQAYDRLFLTGNKISELNGDLDEIRSFEPSFRSEFNVIRADLNNDNGDEILIYSEKEEKLILLDQDLIPQAETAMTAPFPAGWKISYLRSKDDYRTVIQSGNSIFYLRLKSNKFYYLSFLRYPGIYIAFLLFIVLIRQINTLQVVQKEDLKQRLLTLQLQGIKAQLDPHFTFNTLNSVASLIYLKDRQNAYDYLNKFTQLLRIMLNDAEKIYRYLGEEIDFVRTYLELEKLRFDEKLEYKIDIDEGITQREKVPKLVLHTFTENAIKHGILPRPEGGKISIRILREGSYLKLIVEDNGIGREKAKQQPQDTIGKGLKLTGEFYDILNQMNTNPVSFTFHDLYDKNYEPAGTRVEILVPVELGVKSSA